MMCLKMKSKQSFFKKADAKGVKKNFKSRKNEFGVKGKNRKKRKSEEEAEIEDLKARLLIELPQVDSKGVRNIYYEIDETNNKEKELSDQIKNRKLQKEAEAEDNGRSAQPMKCNSYSKEESSAHEKDVFAVLSNDLFQDLPISRKTLRALKENHYIKMSYIQKICIPLALKGYDIQGEAPTGSGKSLAFVIPVIENLYRERWSSMDGLGALIISPTRELAAQIFYVFKQIGKYHNYISIGCIIGGKDMKKEANLVNVLNVIIATPGRLLQHMDESPLWESNQLRILVIDEADRLVDIGFVDTVRTIISSLKKERQSLCFSATLNNALEVINLLSFQAHPIHICVEKKKEGNEVERLKQFYTVCLPEERINILFSFLQTHPNKKILIFLPTCKFVRFIHHIFKKLKLACSLLELHGRQSQIRRLETYQTFCSKRSNVVLLCTDIAARGIDFPVVDWVVQMNIPENTETYIHRVGRTARFENSGQGLMLLLPLELYFVQNLKEKKINVSEIKLNPKKIRNLEGKLTSLLAENVELKKMAQRAISSYIRAIYLTSKKCIFNFYVRNIDKIAFSLGLANPPKIVSRNFSIEDNEDSEEDNGFLNKFKENTLKKQKNMSKLQRLKENIRLKKLAKQELRMEKENNENNEEQEKKKEENEVKEEDDLFEVKERTDDIISHSDRENNAFSSNEKILTFQKNVKKLRFRADGSMKIRGVKVDECKKHLFFEDEVEEDTKDNAETQVTSEEETASNDSFIDNIRKKIISSVPQDKLREKKRVREKHQKQKLKKKKLLADKQNELTEKCVFAEEEEKELSSLEEKHESAKPKKNKNKQIKVDESKGKEEDKIQELENLVLNKILE